MKKEIGETFREMGKKLLLYFLGFGLELLSSGGLTYYPN